MKLIRKIAAYTIYLIAYLIASSITASIAIIGTELSFTDAFMLFNVVSAFVGVSSLILFAAYKAIEWAHKELK
jgi:hypothetical protein